jgi:hypothetical protein
MKTRTLTAALVLAGCSLCLPQPATALRPTPAKKGKNIDIHIAAGADSVRTTYFSLGLLATPRNLNGIGVNVVGTAVERHMNGLQVSGLLNVTGRNANGLQLAGIANVCGERANGLQIGGLMNITGRTAQGVQIGGLMNVNSEDALGVIVGGLMNVTGDDAQGLIVSGLANVTAHRANGLQVSGLMNVAGDQMQGMQVTTLLNVSGRRTRGLQVAALGNISVSMRGWQLAAFNYAKMLHGLQTGALNYADSISHGLQVGVVNYSRHHGVQQLGLVNLHPDTRIQAMVYGGNVGKVNAGVRFLNTQTYTILGVGTQYAGWDKKFTLGLQYRAGLHQLLCPRLRLSEDLGYVHIENLDEKGSDTPARMYALQGRVNLEYALGKKVALFATGGYSLTRHYGKAGNVGHKPIAEWGLILF